MIEHLPHKVRDQLPKISESFAIPEELIAQVKRALERRFFCGRRPSPEEPFSLYHIPWMSLRDLEKLISEIGYRELQAGFSKAGPKGLKTFLVRFPIEEAKKIKTRLLIKGTVPPKDRQMAQRHLATVDLTVTEAKKLPYEIGLSVLAQSAAGESADWIDPLVLKLAPAEGYVLRRYLKEVASNHRLSEVARRQEQLLGVVRHLADEGKISRYWQPRRDDETTGSYHVY